jgi:tRNA pseudouridine32 synthase / 23S rRNA pseudouridine746 synthase
MFPVLFEHPDFIAIDKPEGISSIPTDKSGDDLFSQLCLQFNTRLYAVHRLDKEVSGVILFARNADAHKFLNNSFANHKITKTYQALLIGLPPKSEGFIDAPIREYGSGRMGIDYTSGKPCQTKYKIIQRFQQNTLVEAQPLTGRRHQLRVHFYSLSCPIAGDTRYGNKIQQKEYSRLMLHAASIAFSMPNSEDICINSPLPPSFAHILKNTH